MNPDVFCFADYPCHSVVTDILKAPPEDDNREIATWYVLLLKVVLPCRDAVQSRRTANTIDCMSLMFGSTLDSVVMFWMFCLCWRSVILHAGKAWTSLRRYCAFQSLDNTSRSNSSSTSPSNTVQICWCCPYSRSIQPGTLCDMSWFPHWCQFSWAIIRILPLSCTMRGTDR